MTILEKIGANTRTYASILIGWTIVLLVMRIGEWLINSFTYQFPKNSLSLLGYAFLSDLLFISQAGLLLYILFILLAFISARVTHIVFASLLILVTLVYFSLQKYFNSTTLLLGADLYGYSLKDIKQTVGASGGMNLLTILAILVATGILIGFFFLAKRRIRPGITAAFLIVGFLCLGFTTRIFFGSQVKPGFHDDFENNLAENKLDFFLTASYRHFFPPPIETDIYSDAYSGDYGDTKSSDVFAGFQYINEEQFPFLHANNTADVLTPYFKRSIKAPNIVIILVEGLGRAFSNEKASLGNFTPFLDSLSRESLYWPNFLSGGGRTFAVLPSILGSLPFGKNGFAELKDNMPGQLTLPGILQHNGYSSSFYYSGDASFDNMSLFMQKQKVDVHDKARIPSSYKQLPENNGFSWGYEDAELYRYFLDSRARSSSDRPFIDILLTVSTHSPFLINNAKHYETLFEKHVGGNTLTAAQKDAARNYRQQYITVLYADDALRQFFKEYSKQPGFSNTIFLITGDHRLPEIPMSSKIDRYHVPLIMYSPLLQRTATFNSISSHFDIAPSLIAYLQNNYSMRVPALSTWVGAGLDTARSFRNIHAQALMQTKTDLIDFVQGDYHLNGDRLFRLKPDMQEEPVDDVAIQNMLRGRLDAFIQKNQHMMAGKALLPDSILQAYRP